MRANVLLILACALLLSGCAQEAAGPRTRESSGDVVRVQRGEGGETGEIVGRVMDDEFRPLEAVSVRLQGLDARTKTTQDGIFYFQAVPVGAYQVLLEKTGFESRSQSVVVSAQQRSVIDVIMIQVVNDGPFVDDGFVFRGRINCSVRANASGTNTNPECGQLQAETDVLRQRWFDMLPGVEYLLVELDWRPTVPTVNEKLTLALRPYEGSSWRQIQGPRPVRFMVTPGDFEQIKTDFDKDYADDGGQMQFFVFPGEAVQQQGFAVGTTIQQDFTIYATAWYRMQPPPDYTRLPR